MNRKTVQQALVSVLFLVSVVGTSRADGPATQPAPPAAPPPAAKPEPATPDDQDFVISPMRVQQLKGLTYLFVSSKTNLGQVGDQIRQNMEKFTPPIKSGQVKPIAAPLFIFHGATQDPTAEFTLDTGFPIAEDAKAPDGFEIKKLDQFRCATVIYSGSMQQIHHAFEAVYNDLIGAGLEPTDEARQSVLMFDGPDSVNNVVMIEAGVR